MTVVGALDLDDQLATGDGAHEVEGVHRGLGARVAEAPHRQAEPSGQRLGDIDGVRRRLREVGAQRDPILHRAHDRRIRVTHDVHAVAAVHVGVAGAVDIPHVRAFTVADPHRQRPRAGPAGAHTTRHRALGTLPQCRRRGHAGQEASLPRWRMRSSRVHRAYLNAIAAPYLL